MTTLLFHSFSSLAWAQTYVLRTDYQNLWFTNKPGGAYTNYFGAGDTNAGTSVYQGHANTHAGAPGSKNYALTWSSFGQPVAEVINGEGGEYALSLDGQGYMLVSNAASLNPSSAITFEGWINPASYGPGSRILDKHNYYVCCSDLLTFVANEGLSLSEPLSLDRWTHFAVTWEQGGSMGLYINGQFSMSSGGGSSPLGNSGTDLYIGATTDGFSGLPNWLFQGLMDEFRIWNVALDAETISKQLYTFPSGSETNLVGYWNFNQQNANGSSPYQNNGTLVGSNRFFINNWRSPVITNLFYASNVFSASWTEVSPGVLYQLRIEETNGTLWAEDFTYNTFHTIEPLDLSSGNYQLFVRALGGDVGPWSSPKTFSSRGADTNDQYALSLDGNTAFMVSYLHEGMMSPLNRTGKMTVEAWVKPAGNSSLDNKVLITQDPGYWLSITTNGLSAEVSLYGQPSPTINGGEIVAGRWVHLAVTYLGVGGQIVGYINGKGVVTNSAGNSKFNIGQSMFILGATLAPNQYDFQQLFAGEMDEVRIWNTALDADKIREGMYTRPSGIASNRLELVADWNFNQQNANGSSFYVNQGQFFDLYHSPGSPTYIANKWQSPTNVGVSYNYKGDFFETSWQGGPSEVLYQVRLARIVHTF